MSCFASCWDHCCSGAAAARPDASAQRLTAVCGGIQVSDECRDLLRRALEADVTKRLSIPALLAHPWVARDMPPALAAGLKRHRSGELPTQVLLPHSVCKRCCRAECRRRLVVVPMPANFARRYST
jgi:hypothetical protein